jgi:hypothetical protein
VPIGILAIRGIDVVSAHLSQGEVVRHRNRTLIAAVLAYSASATSLEGLFRKVQPAVDLALLKKTNIVGYRGWIEPEYYRIWENTRFLVEPGALPGPIYVFGNPNYYLLAGRTQSIPIHSDKSFEPYMMLADVCAEFGVSQSTGSAKARAISDALKLGPAFDPVHSRRPYLIIAAPVNSQVF